MTNTGAFMIVTDTAAILYPPLFKDANTDFFVLTQLDTLSSTYWQIKIVPNLPNVKQQIMENPSDFLGIYDKYIYIENNQIVTGLLCEDSACIVTIPAITDLLSEGMDLTPMVKASFPDNPVFTEGAYNGYPLQLSICLPMGNSVDTIENCLRGIKPLLDSFDAELIVLDSSSDGSTQVAARYTDRILPYTWVDDFSHARNSAILEAKGAWILSIDDDEVFDAVREIIDFFKSTDWLKYDAATYVARNYTTSDGKYYSDFPVLRMAGNHPKLHYVGCIHETFDFTFMKNAPRIKSFKSFVHHYGYIYQGDAMDMKKSYRNLRGLYFDLKENPLSLNALFQLCNEVINLEDLTAATAYCYQLISICKLQKQVNPYDAVHYKNMALVFLYHIAQKQGDLNVLSKLEGLTDWEKLNVLQTGTINYLLSFLYFNGQKYDEVCRCAEHYYELRTKYISTADKAVQAQNMVLDLLEPKVRLNAVYFIHSYALLKLGSFAEFEKYFNLVDFDLLELKEVLPYLERLETLVLTKSEDLFSGDTKQYISCFCIYADMLVKWAVAFYSPDMFNTDKFKMLPSNIRGAVCLKTALNLKNDGDIHGYMNHLKLSVVECPLYKGITKLLLKRLVEGV